MDRALMTLGAPRFMGDEQTDKWEEAEAGGARASNDPRGMPHYTAIMHALCVGDVVENSTFVLASSYSDINKLYNAEIGTFSGIRFCSSNMVPSWTGFAQSPELLAAPEARNRRNLLHHRHRLGHPEPVRDLFYAGLGGDQL